MIKACGDGQPNPPIVDVHCAALSQAYWQNACQAEGIERLRMAHEAVLFGYRARGLEMPDQVAF